MDKYVICPECKSNYSLGEKCDCQHIDIIPELIPQVVIERLARPLLPIIEKAFEDPAVVAEYEQWKAERQKKQQPNDCQE